MLDRVPYEIFSQIIKSSYSHITASFDFDETSLPPIEATHVCRSWRAALLSDPTMWTCITLAFTEIDSNELVRILSRSGSAPLDVFIEQGGNPFRPYHYIDLISILPHVLQEMHRLRKLYILIPGNMTGAFLHLLKQPAPMLQKFYLEMRGGEEIERQWVTLQEVYQNLFLGNAPNLKHAHLPISAGFKELQFVSLFENLSRIHLQLVSNTVIDGDILLGILHSLPCLRVLNIIWSRVKSRIICSMPSDYRIPMPFLQELSLQGRCGIYNVNFVLEHLDFPIDKVDFDITCNDSYPKVFRSTALIHFLSQRRFTLLSISEALMAETAINFSEKTDLESSTSSLHSSASSVFRTVYDYYTPLDHLPNFLRKIKMSDITHMCLEDIPLNSTVLRSIFVLLANIQHLRVDHTSRSEDFTSLTKSYLKALMPPVQHSDPQIEAASESELDDWTDSDSDDESNSHVFPCPSLHTLELVFSGPFMEFEEPYIQKLTQCSNIRGQTGHPFKSIIIRCKYPAVAESARTWLQTHELGRLHVVEVRPWSMGY